MIVSIKKNNKVIKVSMPPIQAWSAIIIAEDPSLRILSEAIKNITGKPLIDYSKNPFAKEYWETKGK